jgi:hypothetical protein
MWPLEPSTPSRRYSASPTMEGSMIGDGSERAEQSRLERRRMAMLPKAQQKGPQSRNLPSTPFVPEASDQVEKVEPTFAAER